MNIAMASGRTLAYADGILVEPAGAPDLVLPDGWSVTPGLIDLQVNGMGDAYPLEDPTSLPALDAMLAARGVSSYLVAAPTATPEQITALARAIEGFEGGCLGLHLEGPVLNPAFKGAHRAELMRPGSDAAALALLDLPHVRLVTVAPEVDGAMDYARAAMQRGIAVSAGHSGATAEQAREAIDAGITLCTHLFNAMTPMHQRAPGVAVAYLTDPRARPMFIADGEHLHDDVVSLILASAPERCLLVSDAAPTAGVTQQHGVIAGSQAGLDDAVRRLVTMHGLSAIEAVRLASARPAVVLKDASRGTLALGARADLTIWDNELRVAGCLRAGTMVFRSPPLYEVIGESRGSNPLPTT